MSRLPPVNHGRNILKTDCCNVAGLAFCVYRTWVECCLVPQVSRLYLVAPWAYLLFPSRVLSRFCYNERLHHGGLCSGYVLVVLTNFGFPSRVWLTQHLWQWDMTLRWNWLLKFRHPYLFIIQFYLFRITLIITFNNHHLTEMRTYHLSNDILIAIIKSTLQLQSWSTWNTNDPSAITANWGFQWAKALVFT